MSPLAKQLDLVIGKTPNFPKAGILYYDITGILKNVEVFQQVFKYLVDCYRNSHLSAVVGIESRGFIFAAPLALQLQLPLLLVRKAGKLPNVTVGKTYTLEYDKAEIEAHLGDIPKGKRVLLLDDLLASGGTMAAAIDLFRSAGAIVEDVCAIIGLPSVGYLDVLPNVRSKTLIDY